MNKIKFKKNHILILEADGSFRYEKQIKGGEDTVIIEGVHEDCSVLKSVFDSKLVTVAKYK